MIPLLSLPIGADAPIIEPVAIIRVQGNIQWKVRQGTGGNWIGVSDPLKLTVQAETWSDLMEEIGITLNAILQDLLTSNELDRFLRDQGWKLMATLPPRADDDVRFDVPFIPALIGPDGQARNVHQ